MSVTVQTTDNAIILTTPAEMASISGSRFPAAERIPGLSGEAFDLTAWHAVLTADQVSSTDTALAQPTHLMVRADDEFEAVVPWEQLEGAFFMQSAGGDRVRQGESLRLYVPDGSSACLNVKNIRYIHFASEPSSATEAAYGFRNEISPARLSQSFQQRGVSEAAGTVED